MRKFIATATVAGAAVLLTASAAGAGSPTCANEFGSGWKNHGEHVLTYVHGEGGAGGGKPAHLSSRPDGPAPGASFCLLGTAKNPGAHF